jgi:hypothetical protein
MAAELQQIVARASNDENSSVKQPVGSAWATGEPSKDARFVARKSPRGESRSHDPSVHVPA